MTCFHDRSSIADVVAQEDARAAIQRIAPEVLESPLVADGGSFPLARVLSFIMDEGDPRIEDILIAVRAMEDRTIRPEEAPTIGVPADYEANSVVSASAIVSAPSYGERWRRLEIVLEGPSHGNPFVDVEISATFECAQTAIEVPGFYDGDGTYRIRFLPPAAGDWAFRTVSNARSLSDHTGSITVTDTGARGPVKVDGQFDFAYADGTRYTPIGTTAYAWTAQEPSLQEETLRSLSNAPFNKIRMALFPKHYSYNANEPESFPFPRTEEGWDTTRFDPSYFENLERRIDQLDERGIQADLILFHPYDRWGFAELGKAADDRYVSYVVRRLSSFANVWWSLANEYDLLLSKQVGDWDRIATVIRANDPTGHLLSIHNWVDLWDYTSSWATHCSIQYGERLHSSVRSWRRRWNKPVLVDELGYEGDLEHGWGNLTAEEEVARCWQVVLAGGYVTHGETFWNQGDVVFWAKGGSLRGESPERLRFLKRIISESPTGTIAPLRSDFDTMVGGVEGEYIITYFGTGRPRTRTVTIPENKRARIEVIDTWSMTIEPLPGEHAGSVTVELPARPYVAIRVRVIAEVGEER